MQQRNELTNDRQWRRPTRPVIACSECQTFSRGRTIEQARALGWRALYDDPPRNGVGTQWNCLGRCPFCEQILREYLRTQHPTLAATWDDTKETT